MEKMVRMMILVPAPIKAKLDNMRNYGITASGYIRSLIERDLKMKSRRAHKKVADALVRQAKGG